MAQDALIERRYLRVKRIKIAPELILALLQVDECGTVVDDRRVMFREDAIPLNAKALRCGIDENGLLVLIVEDDSFDEVPEGAPIPDLMPTYSSAEVA